MKKQSTTFLYAALVVFYESTDLHCPISLWCVDFDSLPTTSGSDQIRVMSEFGR